MVLQALEGLSDREAIGRLRRDIAWKAAAGLGLTDAGFHPTVLTLWRARLRGSEAPERIFDAVRKVVDQSGVLSGRVRRVLDSTVLDDAVAGQDTVTMITAQIRRCRRLISQARGVVLSHDYDQGGKPSCDWADSDSRSGLIHSLVSDGLAVLDAVADTDLDKRQSEAVGLLGVVVGQDVEPDPQREGKWRIARRVASDRTISVVDPRARHGRKTSSQRRDGYKAHIAAEPDTGIVTACEITGATTADGPAGVELLDGEPSDTEVIADSAYGSGEVRAKLRAAGHRAIIKPIGQRRNPRLGPDQFTRDDFVIDHDQNRVTCPAGNTATIGTKGQVRFGVGLYRMSPPATMHHQQKRTLPDDPPPRSAAHQSTTSMETTRNQNTLQPSPAISGTDHRLGGSQRKPKTPIPGHKTEPTTTPHPNRRYQSTTAHQPRPPPHPHRLGHQPHLTNRNPP